MKKKADLHFVLGAWGELVGRLRRVVDRGGFCDTGWAKRERLGRERKGTWF